MKKEDFKKLALMGLTAGLTCTQTVYANPTLNPNLDETGVKMQKENQMHADEEMNHGEEMNSCDGSDGCNGENGCNGMKKKKKQTGSEEDVSYGCHGGCGR
ncbi:MAG: hypothetical protein KDK65_04020 [Chlamydiia bacterium]|nr:hypothetical protein [Chlamydiia bacterium]